MFWPLFVMAPRCPRCNSELVKHDRALGGRAVCGECGMVLSIKATRRSVRTPVFRPVQSANRNIRRPAISANRNNRMNLLSWLLPAGIIGGYLYISANPGAISKWMAPYRESTKNSWQISTPADIELLIGKAQQAPGVPGSPASDGVIRDIANNLKSKGVRILVSDYVTPNAGGEWDPAQGEIRIRPSTVLMGTAVLAQALAHEAAHVAQSCRAGGIGNKSEPMGIPVDPAKTYQQQLDSALYKGPISNMAIELEAYSVGAIPEWAPKLLDHYCR